MEIAYNNILRRSKDLTSPYAMPYEDSPSDCWFAQSRQSYNFTEVHFTEEILHLCNTRFKPGQPTDLD